MEVIAGSTPEDPAADMELTGALLRDVAAGAAPCVRVFVPGPTVAFGRLDEREPGFEAAADAARRHGFEPLVRHGGGRAAAYDGGSLVVEALIPSPRIAEGVEERFAWLAELLAGALRQAGVPVELGELPGEYCPGRFSLHAGQVKLAGVAQRSIRGAALVTGAIAVEGGDRLRAVLTDVEAALGVDWDPRTAGSADQVVPGVTVDVVRDAVVAAVGARATPEPWRGQTHGP